MRASDASTPTAALALPGVRAVFTAADLNPGVHEQWYTSMGKNVPDTPRPPMAEEEARFVGDPVALVVAADSYVAEDAIELVEVDYEPLAPVVDYRVARSAEAPGARGVLRERRGSARWCPMSDDLVAVFDSASHDVRRDDRTTGVRPRSRWRPAG